MGAGVVTVFTLLHMKDNYVYDHFIYWQLILQLSFSLFPFDHMHNVQKTGSKLPNIWSYDIIAAIFVYFWCLDYLLLTQFLNFLNFTFMENI